ncbi:MAG: undecaprenyl-diphosphate phosphatase [Lachnospiraceae bacterium]
MSFLEFLKAVIYGVVEGITEWLPVSSTGHLILLEDWLPFESVSEEFMEMFDVVIQLGAILAVVLVFWRKIWPFRIEKGKKDAESIRLMGGLACRKQTMSMWGKILVACVPAAVIGLLFDDVFDRYFYNSVSIAIALIVFGVAFIVVERINRGRDAKITTIPEITYKTALMIGFFQLLAAIFPGTSRSGATIVGALLIGVSRSVAAEFTFFLAIPVMFGASLLKVVKFAACGVQLASNELYILVIASIAAFLVSVVAIRFLMNFVKSHDFSVFGWYRIFLGVFVLIRYWCF